MAEEQYHNKGSHEYESAVVDHDRKEDAVESTDRGLFADLLGKKEEKKPQEEVIVSTDQFEEKVAVSEVPEPKVEKEEYKLEEEKKHDLLDQKLPRSKSSSSSVSIHLYFFALSVTVVV
ncbi:hypothetical protein F2P56_018220 [Juglans regia]|uniref:Uncharacterized protein n=1 Tax=Juglans regia TaxID=51240 RepID=A0A833UUA9_JUGRE|nr:hypothetical protein F2P56_018220 [Juglans regia]